MSKLLGGKMLKGIQVAGETYIYEPDVREAINAALATNEARNKRIAELEDTLRRIHKWDHMDSAADGPYWRQLIDSVLGKDNSQ